MHRSPEVHGLPSEHTPPSATDEAHKPPTQASAVHGLLSWQSAAVKHLPPQPMSGEYVHLPDPGSHASIVHGSLSSQATGALPKHRPP